MRQAKPSVRRFRTIQTFVNPRLTRNRRITKICLERAHLTTSNGVLFAEDCLSILRCIKTNSIDCVFADPPFNLSKNYKNGFHDDIPPDDYEAWSKRWLDECCRVLRPGGALFVYAMPSLAIKFGYQISQSMLFRHWIAVSMKSTFKRGRRLYPAHYALLYYTKGEPRTFNDLRIPIQGCRHCGEDIKDYGGYRRRIHPEGLNLSDLWEDTSPNRHRRTKGRPGVNELPLTIPERAIRMATKVGDVVLDPFGGGGSTYITSEALGRKWIGMEMHDFELVCSRLQEKGCAQAEPELDLGYIFSRLLGA